MTFYYSARGTFDRYCSNDGIPWEKYLEWSRLTNLTELVSVDSMLNEDLVKPKRDNVTDWDNILVDDYYETRFYWTLDYVLRQMGSCKEFNLLAVVINPTQECKTQKLDDFEFVGYDLLDKEYSVSALTNCGGFDETFLPSELNSFGLVSNYKRAYDIQEKLLQNNPDEDHADTNVIAIWRHLTIGRKKPNR
jgi:hypothetical protein